MSAAPTERFHPVARAVAEAMTALRGAAGLPMFGLGDAELRDLAVDVTRLASMLTAVDGAVLAQAESRDVAAEVGATSTANWLAHETKLTRREAHRRVRLARDLDDLPTTAGALAAGDVVAEQAREICHAMARLDSIPEDLVADRDLDLAALKAHAEEHLLAEAEHHDANELRDPGPAPPRRGRTGGRRGARTPAARAGGRTRPRQDPTDDDRGRPGVRARPVHPPRAAGVRC